MKRFVLSFFLAALSLSALGQQSVIIRGQSGSTVGTYDVARTDGSGSLNVNLTGGLAAPGATSVTATTTTPTITSSSGTLLAANTARKSLMIQNNDATGVVYLNFTTTATTANLRLNPNQTFFMSGIVPTSLVRAIGSIASNANVVVIEGQ